MHLTRRKFVALSAVAHFMVRTNGRSITAQQVADRIKSNIGVGWKPETVDIFKAGDPSTAVTRIVTTSLASLQVLDRAVKAVEPSYAFASVRAQTDQRQQSLAEREACLSSGIDVLRSMLSGETAF